jgi:hypothetical protein
MIHSRIWYPIGPERRRFLVISNVQNDDAETDSAAAAGSVSSNYAWTCGACAPATNIIVDSHV